MKKEKWLSLLFFLYIVVFAVVFNFIKLYLSFKFITIIYVIHFLIFIPIFIIYELINKRKIALTLLLLFLLPVSLRFILPKSIIIRSEWKRLYKACVIVLKYRDYGKNMKYDWKSIKKTTTTRPPISWIDFKYYNLQKKFNGSISIYTSSIKVGKKWIFLEYNTQTKKFKIINDKTHK